MYSPARTGLFKGVLCALLALATSSLAIETGGTLYLDMTNMRTEELTYRMIDLDADTLVVEDSAVLVDPDTLLALGPIADSSDYRVDFYLDKNANGEYDGKTIDRSWQVGITETTGDDTIAFVYTPMYTALLWPDEVEPNDIKVDADMMDLGVSYRGYIQNDTDVDRYIVDVPAYAGTLSVAVSVPAESGLEYSVAIRDSSDNSYRVGLTRMDSESLTLDLGLADGHDGKYIVIVSYSSNDGSTEHSATAPYTVKASWDYNPRTVAASFTGFEEHVGQLWKVRLVDTDAGADIVDREWTILEPAVEPKAARGAQAVNTLSYEWGAVLEVGGNYALEFYADVNKDGRYDAPPTDNSWQIPLADMPPRDTVLAVARGDLSLAAVTWDDRFSWVYGGLIASNTVWRSTSSPFLIADTVTVKSGATLTVKEDVEVYAYFDSAAIIANGRLLVAGTEEAPVNFSTYGDDTWGWPGDVAPKAAIGEGEYYAEEWGGIDLVASSFASSIAWARIANGNGELGGGLSASGVELALDNVLIENNYAYDSGGGIYIAGGSVVTGSNIYVVDNLADYNDGGGICAIGSDITLADAVIDGNYADDGNGGGMYAESSTVEISAGSLDDNYAEDSDGGAIYADDSDVTLTDVTLNDNYTYGSGGAIYATASSITVAGSEIDGNNTGSYYGGGIFAEGSTVSITDAAITDNYSSSGAGGIQATAIEAGEGEVEAASVLDLTDVSIAGNEGNYGGGIALYSSELTFMGGELVRNIGDMGTGLLANGSNAELQGVEVSSNVQDISPGECCPTFEEMAGISAVSSAISLTQCSVSRNVVGVAVIGDDSKLDVNSSIVHGNVAAGIMIMKDSFESPGPEVAVVYSSVQDYLDPQEIDDEWYTDEGGWDGLLAALDVVLAELTNVPQSLGVWPGPGNTTADPLFIVPAGADRDFGLHFMSPAINAGDPALPLDADGTQADMGAYPLMIRESGLMASDVPNDQGGAVYLKWWASKFDINVNDLTHYSIWRSSTLGWMGSPPARVTKVGGTVVAWEWLGDVPAHRLDAYAYLAATLEDRTLASNGYHWFMVSAQTANPNVFHDSEPVLTHSVDNLAPAPPAARLAVSENNTVTLAWDVSRASANSSRLVSDLRAYEVWRGDSEIFSLEGAEFLGSTHDTLFVDESPIEGTMYYHVLAEDVHDNKSIAGTPVEVVFTNIVSVPTEFRLHANAPNPFNPSTTIRFDLVDADFVRVAIYNTQGQLIRTLLERDMAAGRHEIVWNGLDKTGREMSSGVYLYRLESNQGIDTKRMTLVR